MVYLSLIRISQKYPATDLLSYKGLGQLRGQLVYDRYQQRLCLLMPLTTNGILDRNGVDWYDRSRVSLADAVELRNDSRSIRAVAKAMLDNPDDDAIFEIDNPTTW